MNHTGKNHGQWSGLKKPAYSHKLEATLPWQPVPCSRRGQDQRPAVTERDAQLDLRWWCFDIDLLTLSASAAVVEVLKGVVEVV